MSLSGVDGMTAISVRGAMGKRAQLGAVEALLYYRQALAVRRQLMLFLFVRLCGCLCGGFHNVGMFTRPSIRQSIRMTPEPVRETANINLAAKPS